MRQNSDRLLARRLRAGDEAAFTEFFDGHFPRLYRFALPRVGHDHDVAEEVVQSTLCRAISRIATYRGEAPLFTWLCTFCRHEIAAHFRREGRQPLTVDLVDESAGVLAALDSLRASHGDGPDDVLRRKELAGVVQLVLDRLPGRYGDALEWKYIEGLSVREIARRLDTTAKAAESLLTRARQAFRDGFSAATAADACRDSLGGRS